MKPVTFQSKAYRSALLGALALGALALPVTEAFAVSEQVKMACADDYFSYCSAYEVGSAKLRQCMRAVGPKLSRGCINALISAGEVSKAEVARRAANLR
jgi:hypothetical protein